jgi:Tfp pilus assembly pilus retraction ATPase PilT
MTHTDSSAPLPSPPVVEALNVQRKPKGGHSTPPEIVLQVNRLIDAEDFTVYLPYHVFRDQLSAIPSAQPLLETFSAQSVIEETITLHDDVMKCKGRALICLCHTGYMVSITLRRKGKMELHLCMMAEEETRKRAQRKLKPVQTVSVDGKACISKTEFEGNDPLPKYYNTFSHVYSELYELIFPKGTSPQGLIVVAGSTSTGKSNIARGLIDLRLRALLLDQCNAKDVKRRPHLVTFEDPIEQSLYKINATGGIEEDNVCQAYATFPETLGIDYTPRQKRYDINKLSKAFLHAKRQTPAIFYVGEVRANEDWIDIVDFAGAGNLVIATTHANSVVETVKKIFQALKVQTSADRGQVAARLLGIIHLKPAHIEITHDNATFYQDVTIPALWRRTQLGMSELISDGLSSIMPHGIDGKVRSSIGRRHFAEKLHAAAIEMHKDLDSDNSRLICLHKDTWQSSLLQKALELDLDEM